MPPLWKYVSDFEVAVGTLLIKCPKTGRELSTGIQVEADEASNLPQVACETRCPHCGSVHFWLPREAKWVEAIPRRHWVENQIRHRIRTAEAES